MCVASGGFGFRDLRYAPEVFRRARVSLKGLSRLVLREGFVVKLNISNSCEGLVGVF